MWEGGRHNFLLKGCAHARALSNSEIIKIWVAATCNRLNWLGLRDWARCWAKFYSFYSVKNFTLSTYVKISCWVKFYSFNLVKNFILSTYFNIISFIHSRLKNSSCTPFTTQCREMSLLLLLHNVEKWVFIFIFFRSGAVCNYKFLNISRQKLLLSFIYLFIYLYFRLIVCVLKEAIVESWSLTLFCLKENEERKKNTKENIFYGLVWEKI